MTIAAARSRKTHLVAARDLEGTAYSLREHVGRQAVVMVAETLGFVMPQPQRGGWGEPGAPAAGRVEDGAAKRRPYPNRY